MGDRKRVKKDNFDMSSMQKAINIITIDTPSEVKSVFAVIPETKNLKSPFQIFFDYNQKDRKYFIECLEKFTNTLLTKVANGYCYLSYNYHSNYDDSLLYVPADILNDKLRKKEIYNYALDIFYIELIKRGYNPNKQFHNSNSMYIEVILNYK